MGKGSPQRRLPLSWQKKKARSRPFGRNRAFKCVKPVSARKGAKPYLTARSGRDASINVLSVPQERPVVKKTAHQLDTCHLFLRPTL